jgi:hypothetical protein
MDRLMLNTTWNVIRKHVATIIMVIDPNVRVPLRFAFGAAETMGLFEQRFEAFTHRFGIDLNHYILESDQVSALCSLCTNTL